MNPIAGSQKMNISTEVDQILREKFSAWLKRSQSDSSAGRIARFETEIKHQDILQWLAEQDFAQKLYWSDRENGMEVAGLGVADSVSGGDGITFDSILGRFSAHLTREYPDLRYYGGICFDVTNCNGEWNKFGTYRFWLPRFEFFRKDGRTFFACNLLSPEKASFTDILSEFDAIRFSVHKDPQAAVFPQKRTDYPRKEEWINSAKNVIETLKNNQTAKVVLARKTVLEFTAPLDPYYFLSFIKKISPNCYHFCFQPDTENVFLGASPERLYKRMEQQIFTEALAGTRPRGATAEEDEKLRNELIHSAKDHHEHQLVVDGIKESLRSFCLDLRTENERSLLKLKGGHHLLTPLTGRLNQGVSDARLLQELHPTPAVAGCPTKEALATIARLEPFSRGWYAGPIGYVGHDQSEFAVAIRCGLIQNNRLTLFSGAGIVAASVAHDEWQEVENKIKIYLKAFPAGNAA